MRAAYIVLAAIMLLFGAQLAVTQTPLPGQTVADQRKALSSARAQAAEAKSRSEALERKAASAKQSADKVRRQILAVTARIQEAEANISAAQARVSIIAQLQKQQRARLAVRQKPIVKLAAALQHMARRPTALSLVQPGSVRDMVRVRGIMASTLPELEKRTVALRSEVERGKKLRAQADNAAKILKATRGRLAERRSQLAKLETQRRVESRKLASSAGLESDRAMALGEEANDIVDLMDKIRDSGEIRENLAALDGPVLRPPRPSESEVVTRSSTVRKSGRPAYRLPAQGGVVTGLGELSEGGVRARGLTLATQANAQVIAPADGRIAFAGPYRGYGKILIIEHDAGWVSLITSLADVSVKVGDTVVQGSPIGNAAAKDPTITVELRRNGRPIDIVRLITA